jgi:LmbE family N-acetylglucosaminyl deacetylase
MKFIFFWMVLLPSLAFSQSTRQPDAAQIKLKLRKLNVLSSVLYMAAHPDDENTRIITYMANDQLATTGYLSLTRGDGGQNLIGSEIRDLLGLIRTQELQAARRIDGGRQFFSRANDFGFSKSADETFKTWNKDEVLSDVVRVFRQYQPDVIITRFPPDERAGHGHHTASAILAQEAFDAAAKGDSYPELAQQFGTWQTKRLYTNTGRWWNTSINENTPGVITLNVGTYSTLLGQSYSEIAAISRSQHRSQGFGSRGTRGDQLEFLEYVKGEKAEKNIFEGINTTWTRVKGGDKIQPLVVKAIDTFQEDNPAASVSQLIAIRQAILQLPESVWKSRKLEETEQLIVDCLGLFVEVTADQYYVAPGQKVIAGIELVNRSGTDVMVDRIEAPALAVDSTLSLFLKKNALSQVRYVRTMDVSKSYSSPYWLTEPHGVGLFTVLDKSLIGKPENDPAVLFIFSIRVGTEKLKITRPLIFKWTDQARGELARPFEVVPPVFVNLSGNVIIFSNDASQEVKVTVKSASDGELNGNVKLDIPAGWKVTPAMVPFSLSSRGAEKSVSFQVFPSATEETVTLRAIAVTEKGSFDHSIQTIAYDHIPTQTLLPKAEAKLVRINLKKEGSVIGYIRGAGDETPTALRTMGYTVLEMRNEDVTPLNLKRMDAVVLGVRALNTNERIGFLMTELLDYVKNGGTLVVQYNVANPLKTDRYAPYPLQLSGERVTEEDAAVTFLKPEHAVLNYPNVITAKDFDGWVQERGLYFPTKWDASYETILSMHDKNDAPKESSLLVAKYGSGYYVYTGLSFFRELPEGVAGAYKLFANLVSLHAPKLQAAAPTKKRRSK